LLWYDTFLKKNSTFTNLNKRGNRNYLLRKRFTKLDKLLLRYMLPTGWNLLILFNKTKGVYFLKAYSNVYSILIPLVSKNNIVSFDSITNQVFISTPYINNYTVTYANFLNSFFYIFLKPNFTKLKFKGKGYYIYKNYRNTITPQFGYSHRLYVYMFYTYVLFFSKTSLIIFGLNYKHVRTFSEKIRNWRFINIFTGRGVRFSNQVVYRKSGKISTYR
jgi:hypothetical protein